MVEGEGFEPTHPGETDLQSAAVHRLCSPSIKYSMQPKYPKVLLEALRQARQQGPVDVIVYKKRAKFVPTSYGNIKHEFKPTIFGAPGVNRTPDLGLQNRCFTTRTNGAELVQHVGFEPTQEYHSEVGEAT